MAWPTIIAPSSIEEKDYTPQIKTESEANYVQSRRRGTRSRMLFKLTWESMSTTDYELLKAAVRTDMGSTFSWTHPLTSTVYECRYSSDGVQGRARAGRVGSWTVSVEIEEA